MYMEYAAEILRGWPGEGALDRVEVIKQGSSLVNGDVVEMQIDGTVDKVSATANKYVGLVVRGNGDNAGTGSNANALGRLMTPQPTKTVTAMSWATGTLSVTVAGHGYARGNTVVIAGTTTAACNGTYVITGITSSSVFTVALVASPGAITVGSSTATLTAPTQGTLVGASGEAVVLWSNYIVKTTNYTAGAYVPGSPVSASNGKFALATGGDPVLGHVLRVQGGVTSNSSTNAQTAHLVIAVY